MTEQDIANKNNYEKEFKKKWGLISKLYWMGWIYEMTGNEQGVKY